MKNWKTAFRTWAARRGYLVRGLCGLSLLEVLLLKQLKRNPDFSFLQIGANDGILCDELAPFVRQYRLRGVVVEPLPDVFRQLMHNYRDQPQVRGVQAALHRTLRRALIHRADLSAPRLPAGAPGMASFNRDHLRRFGVPEAHILSEEVPCLTFQELIEQQGIRPPDLLMIDTEGYDREILAMVDFERFRPALVRFEHGLGDQIMTWAELQECLHRLHEHGYLFAMEPYDVIAYQPDPWQRVPVVAQPRETG